jgi:hypothetical protein
MQGCQDMGPSAAYVGLSRLVVCMLEIDVSDYNCRTVVPPVGPLKTRLPPVLAPGDVLRIVGCLLACRPLSLTGPAAALASGDGLPAPMPSRQWYEDACAYVHETLLLLSIAAVGQARLPSCPSGPSGPGGAPSGPSGPSGPSSPSGSGPSGSSPSGSGLSVSGPSASRSGPAAAAMRSGDGLDPVATHLAVVSVALRWLVCPLAEIRAPEGPVGPDSAPEARQAALDSAQASFQNHLLTMRRTLVASVVAEACTAGAGTLDHWGREPGQGRPRQSTPWGRPSCLPTTLTNPPSPSCSCWPPLLLHASSSRPFPAPPWHDRSGTCVWRVPA